MKRPRRLNPKSSGGQRIRVGRKEHSKRGTGGRRREEAEAFREGFRAFEERHGGQVTPPRKPDFTNRRA